MKQEWQQSFEAFAELTRPLVETDLVDGRSFLSRCRLIRVRGDTLVIEPKITLNHAPEHSIGALRVASRSGQVVVEAWSDLGGGINPHLIMQDLEATEEIHKLSEAIAQS